MAYLYVADLKLGMDRRRPQATGVPGTLWIAKNGFVNRGGDFERAKAFDPTHTLPAGTFGLAELSGQLYVFGSATAPTMPVKVQYQQLAAGSADMVRVLDARAFDGALYVIAEFDDGGVYHFYDGTRVTDWDALSDANSSFAAVAEALAAKVEEDAAVQAVAIGEKVVITAAAPGTAFTCSGSITDNGDPSTPAATATQLVANVAEVSEVRAEGVVTITGGSSGSANKITSLTVNAVELLDEEVEWVSSHSATANALALAVNNHSSTSGYTAEAIGTGVTITAAVGTGATPNGYAVVVTAGGDVTASVADLAGGVAYVAPVAQVYQVVIGTGTFDAEDLWKITVNGAVYQTTGRGAGAGTSIFIHKGRVWSTARSLVRYCGPDDPTDWSTTATPAPDSGFINIATDSEGSQRLVGMAVYQGNAAIFSRSNIIIYALSADATEISLVDTLEQTGTMSPRAVVPYGNLDVYYLDESGIRSIRSRDGYNAAYVSDVGGSIDGFVQEWLTEIDESTLSRAVAVIDPVSGRYMLAVGERIFGLSYYPSSKITAWSYVEPGFDVEHMLRVERRIYARSADVIYCYGGEDGTVYPDAGEQVVTLETPFMSANDPAGFKGLFGFDMAGEGDWLVEVLVDPNDTTKVVTVGVINKVTYNQAYLRVPGTGTSALLAVRFTCEGEGAAKLSNFAVHYEKQDAA